MVLAGAVYNLRTIGSWAGIKAESHSASFRTALLNRIDVYYFYKRTSEEICLPDLFCVAKNQLGAIWRPMEKVDLIIVTQRSQRRWTTHISVVISTSVYHSGMGGRGWAGWESVSSGARCWRRRGGDPREGRRSWRACHVRCWDNGRGHGGWDNGGHIC